MFKKYKVEIVSIIIFAFLFVIVCFFIQKEYYKNTKLISEVENKFGKLHTIVLTEKFIKEINYNGPAKICKNEILYVGHYDESYQKNILIPILDDKQKFISCSESEINKKLSNAP